jgi:hypothetical protein
MLPLSTHLFSHWSIVIPLRGKVERGGLERNSLEREGVNGLFFVFSLT